MTELKKALVQAHNTSPGPDGITYTMLRHLNPDSITNILFLFNRVWKEHCFTSSWRETIVIPILKPGKVATDPLSYRPIAMTSCFCKTFERMNFACYQLVCGMPSTTFRTKAGQLSANYFIRAKSVPSHPLKPFALAIGLNRLYEARSFNIKPFSERANAVLNDAHLRYDKASTANVIYQQLFSSHRSKFSKYIPAYTDGSKTAGHVGCGVVFNKTILNFTLHNSMSVFSAELTAILVVLQHIIVSNHRHFCVYTDSMSALESLHFLTERRHPTVMKIRKKGF
ncbi:RNase H domain-containing protein [Trichonephila clavipes]|nr:RNase H domain-containing protein [Trichonephila clavipes]